MAIFRFYHLPSTFRILLLTLLLMPAHASFAYNSQDNSEANNHTHSHEDESAQKAEAPSSPDARPQMVKITSKGLSPAQLTMLESDSVVFFYNDTDDDLATLEVDFGSRAVHCAAALKVVKEPGLARSRKPFGPKEFASTCFHDKGQYSYRIFTSDKGKTPYTGTVIVQ